MSTCTCQILVGQVTSRRGGLAAGTVQQLLLTEGDRLAWRLFGSSLNRPTTPLAIWIPENPETALEDAFLMIAYHIVRDRPCRNLLDPHLPEGGAGIEMGVDLPTGAIKEARLASQRCEFQRDGQIKLIICAFLGSVVSTQLACARHYNFDYEMLRPTFCRGRGNSLSGLAATSQFELNRSSGMQDQPRQNPAYYGPL
jgi:hypothetical protein